MTEKHSPLLKVVVGTTGKVVVQIDEPLGLFVADCSMTDQGHDWAALIVRSVNGLPEAIAALEDAKEHLAMDVESMTPGWKASQRIIDQIDAALTKLKG